MARVGATLRIWWTPQMLRATDSSGMWEVGQVTEVLPDEAACALSLVDIVLD